MPNPNEAKTFSRTNTPVSGETGATHKAPNALKALVPVIVGLSTAACAANGGQLQPTEAAASQVPLPTGKPTDVDPVNPSPVPSSTPAAPEVTNTPVASATPKASETPAPSPTPSFEQWLQGSAPDSKLVTSVEGPYMKAMGVSAENIKLEPQIFDGPNGKFAVMVDKGTGVPLLITGTDKSGAREGEPVTFGRMANNMWAPDQKTPMRSGVLMNPDYKRLAGKWGDFYNFAIATLGKEHFPSANDIRFRWTGSQIDEAKRDGMPARVQHILIPAFPPDWMANGFTMENLKTMVMNSMNAAAKTGDVKDIIVVNEADGTAFRKDPYWDKFQMDYVMQAFQTARSMNTSIQLGYNDSDNHWSGGMTTKNTKTIVDALKSKGLIDFVGVEMHLRGENGLDKADVIKTLQSYGIPVRITEFDIDMTNVPAEQREAKRAQLTKTVFEACFESKVCDEISFWGADDSQSWLGPEAQATQYDANGNPRLSVFVGEKAMLDAIVANQQK